MKRLSDYDIDKNWEEQLPRMTPQQKEVWDFFESFNRVEPISEVIILGEKGGIRRVIFQ